MKKTKIDPIEAAYREGVRQGKARERARLRKLAGQVGQSGVMRDLNAVASRRIPKR